MLFVSTSDVFLKMLERAWKEIIVQFTSYWNNALYFLKKYLFPGITNFGSQDMISPNKKSIFQYLLAIHVYLVDTAKNELNSKGYSVLFCTCTCIYKKKSYIKLTHLKHRLYPIAKASEMGKALNNMKNELDWWFSLHSSDPKLRTLVIAFYLQKITIHMSYKS